MLDVLLPPACALCGADATADGVCSDCLLRVDAQAAASSESSESAETRAPRGLQHWRAGGLYAGAERGWMRRFKYPEPGLRGIDPAAEIVVRSFVLAAARRMPCAPPQAVLAIPGETRRSRRRGFAPALLLARAVARATGAPLLARGLGRTRETVSQTGLSADARRTNVAGAFVAPHALPRRVWIVDDLFTTGATLAEAARAARRSGAREVGAVAALRTPSDVDAPLEGGYKLRPRTGALSWRRSTRT